MGMSPEYGRRRQMLQIATSYLERRVLVLLAVLVRPSFVRRLLTVAAAISFERFSDRPSFFSEALMCSYCRSSLLVHDRGMLPS